MTRYETAGVCPHFMDVDTDGKTVRDVVIYGGCRGQAKALPSLVKGRSIDDVVKRCKGIECHGGTSCADQLARILEIEKRTKRKKRLKILTQYDA